MRSARGARPGVPISVLVSGGCVVSPVLVASLASRIPGLRAAILVPAPRPVVELLAAVFGALPHEHRSLSQLNASHYSLLEQQQRQQAFQNEPKHLVWLHSAPS